MGQGPAPPGGGFPASRGPGRPRLRDPAISRRRRTPACGRRLRRFSAAGGRAPAAHAGAVLDRDLRQPGNKTVGPIVGVRSKVHHKALKKWRDKEWYDEWRFIAGDADNDDKSWFDPNSLRGPNVHAASPEALKAVPKGLESGLLPGASHGHQAHSR